MARQPGKCCCCVPLRPGLLAWAYIKLVLALTSIGLYCCFSRLHISIKDYFNYPGSFSDPAIYLLKLLWPLAVCLLYLVFTIIFIIGVHRENIKLLLVFLVYSLFEVILGGAALGWQVYLIVDELSYYRHTEYYNRALHRYLDEPVVYLQFAFLVVVNILLPIYFMVLIKSEVQRLKMSRRGTRVVLGRPATTEQDKRYNVHYSG